MPPGHSLSHRRREGNPRALHAQRSANARQDELLVTLVRPTGERVTEKTESQIGVFVVGTGIEAQRVAGQKRVQLFDSLVRQGVGPVLRCWMVGIARQARRIRSEV